MSGATLLLLLAHGVGMGAGTAPVEVTSPSSGCVEAGEVFSPGGVTGEVFSPGAAKGEAFSPGAAKGEVYC